MTTVNIVDAPCGFDKTSWAIQYMNFVPEDQYRFIYVTPFLDEVDRVKAAVQNRTFYEPESHHVETKLEDLHRLLGQGKNIATTHALFKSANAETRELIRSNNYILILDEVMNVIEQVPLKKHDLSLLFNAGAIELIENERGITYIRWLESKSDYDTEYNNIKKMALSGNLMFCDETTSAVIWHLPCELFLLFKDVFILTYLFKGQFQRYYYDLFGINYRYLSVENDNGVFGLVPYSQRKAHDKSSLCQLINIYYGRLNDIDDKRTSLSTSWFEKNKNLTETLRNNTYNYLSNLCKANKNTALWTTVKGDKDSIMKRVKPKGFAKSFIPMASRATNQYKDRYHLAYITNRFMNPIEKRFFEQYEVNVDQDAWALSELIQLVWRSRIRNCESVNLYIPSSRMRGLLETYLTSDHFETLPENAVINEPPSDWHL